MEMKKMLCRGCNRPDAYQTRTIEGGIEVCNFCGETGSFWVPDVFVDKKPEENLPDDPSTGKPPTFSSKMEKYHYLKQNHLVEARGRVHGGPALPPAEPTYNKEAARTEALTALAKVKEMGRDYRRQEYRRIMKETENAR